MREKPSLKVAFFHTSIYQVIGMPLGFLSSVLLARILGTEGRGDLSILLTTMGMLLPIMLVIIGGNDILAGGKFSRESALLIQTLKWVTILSLLLFLGLFLIAKIKVSLFGVPFYSLDAGLSALYIWMSSIEIGVRSILMAKQEFYFINKQQLISKFVVLFFVIIFYYIGSFSVREAFLIFIVQQGLILLGYLFRLPKLRVRLGRNYQAALLKRSMTIGKRVFFTSIPTLLLLKVDIVMLGAMTNSATVGVYAVAVGVSGLYMTFTGILNRLIKAKAVSEEGGADRAVFASKIVFFAGIIMFIPILCFSEKFFSFVYGQEYLNSYKSFILLWMAVTIWGGASPLAGYAVAKRHYPKEVVIGMNIALLLNIALNFILIPDYQEIGAAVASVVAYGAMAVTYALAFHREDGRSYLDLICFTSKERIQLIKIFNQGYLWLRRI